MNKADLSIILVNWNGKPLLKDCLESIEKQSYKNFNIIIVDNGSSDGSVEFINKKYPEIKIIKLKENKGFACPNNIGIKEALKNKGIKYIITLNNDTKADKDYLKELVHAAKNEKNVGSFQPKVVNFFEKNKIDSVGILIFKDCSAVNKGQQELDRGQYDKKEEIFGASASAALYTREVLEKIKLSEDEYFDEDYFAYYEDVDLAWRIRLVGFKSLYIPTAKILHVHSATGKNYSAFKAFHIFRNQYYNIIKNLPAVFLIRTFFFLLINYCRLIIGVIKSEGPSSNLKKNINKKNEDKIYYIILRSWRDVLLNFPKMLKKRFIIQKGKKITNKECENLFIRFSK